MLPMYWIAFLVGGTFVALSLVGGGHDTGGGGGGHDFAGDAGPGDLDGGGHDFSGDADHGDVASHGGSASGAGPGLADLLSLRFGFLFAAFFGLTGLALTYLGDEPGIYGALVAVLVGLVVGLGGNVTLRRFTEERVSSEVRPEDLIGRTARVTVPMSGASRGTVRVVSQGSVVMLPARVVAGDESYRQGEEVVIVRMDGRTAEVVRPGPADDAPDASEAVHAPRVRA